MDSSMDWYQDTRFDYPLGSLVNKVGAFRALLASESLQWDSEEPKGGA